MHRQRASPDASCRRAAAAGRRAGRGATVSVTLWTAAVLALLGVLILVHELGHFLLARLFGVKVLRFSLGFGPKLVSWVAGATEYRLSLFPLGGYVRLLGEDPEEPVAEIDRGRTLHSKPLWQRYAIVVAGPAFNLLLPIGIYFFHYMGQRTLLPPTVGTVLSGLPAAQAGLLPGDRVETVNGSPIRYWEELERTIASSPGKTLRLGVRRGPDAEERDVTPVRVERPGSLRLREVVGWVGISPRFHLPEVGVIDTTSPAWQAGLRTFDYVVGVNGLPVAHWAEFEKAVARAGASPLRMSYLRGAHSEVPFAHIEIEAPGTAVVIPQPVLDEDGHRRYQTGLASSDLFVYSVEPGSPADRIGIRRGDQLLELDGQPLLHWDLLVQRLAAEPKRSFRISWLSPGGLRHEAHFTQEERSKLDAYRQEEQRLVFGASNRFAWKTDQPVPVRNRFFYALGHSVSRTGQIVLAMSQGFVQIIRGQIPTSSLGGPLMIGYVAGVAAEQGLAQYLWLMALLSINLGLLNFLPIPILDGGLLMFFTIELAKGRPPSARARQVASYVGLVVVVLLMALALKNDVVRLILRG
jgi:regulator of sigma E protease